MNESVKRYLKREFEILRKFHDKPWDDERIRGAVEALMYADVISIEDFKRLMYNVGCITSGRS